MTVKRSRHEHACINTLASFAVVLPSLREYFSQMTLNAALQKLSEQLYKATQLPDLFERETGRVAFQRRIQKEPSLRDVIDEACQQFAESGTLPIADPEVGFFILDRFAEASHCGRTMSDFADAEGPWLEWLLIEYWELAGLLRWRDRINHMQTE